MPREHLTPNACLRCREKRTKCDGQPTCKRCKERKEECLYEDKKLRTKGHLRSEIKRLQTDNQPLHDLLRALTNHVPERCEEAWNRMRAGVPPDSTAEWIVVQSSWYTAGRSKTLRLGHEMASAASPPSADPEFGCLIETPSTILLGGPAAQGRPYHGAKKGGGIKTISVPEQPIGPSVDPPKCRLGAGSPLPVLRETATQTPARATRGMAWGSSFQDDFDAQTFLPDPGGCMTVFDLPRRRHFPFPESSIGPITYTWTEVTSDTGLVQRLLAGFFASPLSYLFLVSERHFVQDFREGNCRYCSEALVNAILGTACNMITVPSQLVSRLRLEDAFIGQAKRLLLREPSLVNLPCIQALGVLALAEMARRNQDEAVDLARESLRACIHLLLHQQNQHGDPDDEFGTVLGMTYCGVLSLNRLIRLLSGNLELKGAPLLMRIHTDWGDLGDDTPEARVERGILLYAQFYRQLQYCPPLARFVFKVTEAVHTFRTYSACITMTADDLDGTFRRCISYHRQVAGSLAHDEGFEADVLLARIWFHYCLFSLLRPLVSGSENLVDELPLSLFGDKRPDTVCRQASETVIGLADTYQTRYSLSYVPPLLPHMVFDATVYQRSLAAGLLMPGPRKPTAPASASASASTRPVPTVSPDRAQGAVAGTWRPPDPLGPPRPFAAAALGMNNGLVGRRGVHMPPLSCQNPRDEWPIRSPKPRTFPGPMQDPVYSAVEVKPTVSTAWAPEQWSPSRCVLSPGSAVRKDSATSMSSACFSSDEQGCRSQSSICGAVSSATSDSCRAEVDLGALNGERASMLDDDTAPESITPQPQSEELADIGYLQLMSMGAQHEGAASAASLLRRTHDSNVDTESAMITMVTTSPGGFCLPSMQQQPESGFLETDGGGDAIGAAVQPEQLPPIDRRGLRGPVTESNHAAPTWCEGFPMMEAQVRLLSDDDGDQGEGPGSPGGVDGWDAFMSDSPEGSLN